MRLRSVVLGFGAAALAVGVVAMLAGFPPAFVWVFWGGVIVLAIVYERVIYKPLKTASPGVGWERTTERFIDDETGATVTVYVEPKTGERAYVKE